MDLLTATKKECLSLELRGKKTELLLFRLTKKAEVKSPSHLSESFFI
jgi:hypothetical protein